MIPVTRTCHLMTVWFEYLCLILLWLVFYQVTCSSIVFLSLGQLTDSFHWAICYSSGSFSSPDSLICCHLTPWELNIPHGALPHNDNTHLAGQVIIFPAKLPPPLNLICVPQSRIWIQCRVYCPLLHTSSFVYIYIPMFLHIFCFYFSQKKTHSYPKMNMRRV